MIIRKGDEQAELGLAQAAAAQKKERRAAGPAARDEAGRSPISNIMVQPGGKSVARDYSTDRKTGRPDHYMSVHQPVSGTVVSERTKKMVDEGKSISGIGSVARGGFTQNTKRGPGLGAAKKKIGNQKAAFGEMGSGRIKGGVLQPSKSSAPAKVKAKAATAKDVRSALGSGNIDIEEAAGLNKKGLSSPLKKKKK
jgi:hypothetical protein